MIFNFMGIDKIPSIVKISQVCLNNSLKGKLKSYGKED